MAEPDRGTSAAGPSSSRAAVSKVSAGSEDPAEPAAAYDVSIEQAGPYRGTALARAPSLNSSEDLDLYERPSASLALPPPSIYTLSSGGATSLPSKSGREGGSGEVSASVPAEDADSPKRSSALDLTGAAIIKPAPGEGRNTTAFPGFQLFDAVQSKLHEFCCARHFPVSSQTLEVAVATTSAPHKCR